MTPADSATNEPRPSIDYLKKKKKKGIPRFSDNRKRGQWQRENKENFESRIRGTTSTKKLVLAVKADEQKEREGWDAFASWGSLIVRSGRNKTENVQIKKKKKKKEQRKERTPHFFPRLSGRGGRKKKKETNTLARQSSPAWFSKAENSEKSCLGKELAEFDRLAERKVVFFEKLAWTERERERERVATTETFHSRACLGATKSQATVVSGFQIR